MRFHGCSAPAELRERHRLHYCGTCKTIGTLYGQKARFLLNHDTVFLAELLTAIEGEKTESWHKRIKSRNCFALPEESQQIPLALQAAASANVLLAQFKVRDSVADSGGPIWRGVERVFSHEFAAASERMVEFGFPADRLWDWFDEQLHREGNAPPSFSARHILNYYAEPTASVTASVFESAARMVAAETVDTVYAMHRFGAAFGSLVYLVDAVEDEARDERKGQFNPLSILRKSRQFDDDELRSVVQHAYNSAAAALNAIPCDVTLRANFKIRLLDNIRSRLGPSWVPQNNAGSGSKASSCHSSSHAPGRRHHHAECQQIAQEKYTASRNLWRWAWGRAGDVSANTSIGKRSGSQARASPGQAALAAARELIETVLRPVVFAWVLFVSLTVPEQSERFATVEEFADLALNLIFWGAASGAMLRAATYVPRRAVRLLPGRMVASRHSAGLARFAEKPARTPTLPDFFRTGSPSTEAFRFRNRSDQQDTQAYRLADERPQRPDEPQEPRPGTPFRDPEKPDAPHIVPPSEPDRETHPVPIETPEQPGGTPATEQPGGPKVPPGGQSDEQINQYLKGEAEKERQRYLRRSVAGRSPSCLETWCCCEAMDCGSDCCCGTYGRYRCCGDCCSSFGDCGSSGSCCDCCGCCGPDSCGLDCCNASPGCCAGADCCAGSGDCCAGSGDCCSGGADCCSGGADCCSGGADCGSGCSCN